MTAVAVNALSEEAYFHLTPAITHLEMQLSAHQLQHICLDAHDQLHLSCAVEQLVEVLICDEHFQPISTGCIECLALPQMPAQHTLAQLHSHSLNAKHLQQQLAQHQIKLELLDHVYQLNCATKLCLTATAKIHVYVFNTGPDADVCQQNGIQAIDIRVQFSEAKTEYLPHPLAPVLQEIRVPRASARTYTVKAGEWIQIIDVSGKQCSDFLAFDTEALAKGEELGLDAVSTRSILGLANPAPGLHSRFYDSELRSMLEVVQDTVGRHDMFLTACSPKFYQDAGYFGHVSCTDNFNRVLAAHGIAARQAWPAINFFYNTQVEASGQISMAEPWSRAGDYVLLRAQRDLLCASSACPDEIDPSNGWMPTDIHVRIYPKTAHFERSHHYRLQPEEMPRMTKTSGFYSRIQALTPHVSEYRGYWVANHYSGWGAKAEYLACRERVAMIDLTPLRKFDIQGPDAEAFLQHVLTRNVRKLAIHEIVYSAMCLDTAGMIDDGTLFRLGEQNFRWICGDEYSGTWLREQAQKLNYRVSIRHVTDHIHNLALQGPKSRELLNSLLWTAEHQTSIQDLKWFHLTQAKLGGANGIPVMVSRTGYTGELGFEIWCHPEHALTLWDTLWQAGQAYDIAPLGFDALDLLRIEAGLIFAHHEFDASINPFEAGIGFTVPLKTKTEDFIGKAALQAQTTESRQKLMGLILAGNEPVHHGDLIYAGRFPVGVVTSACQSPLLQKQIALCRLMPQYAQLGTQLEVGQLDGLKKRLAASVVSLPFYDPERTRVRS